LDDGVDTVVDYARSGLYSLADWRFHRGRLGYDDLVDARGRFALTVSVMDFAVDEMLTADALSDGKPRQLLVLGRHGHWSIYLDVEWLTPRNVQSALDIVGRLLGKSYRFEPDVFPRALERRLRAEAVKRDRKIERERDQGRLIDAGEFLKTLRAKAKTGVVRARPQRHRKVSRQRLAELSTHKMKF
jgi:hypothetical protein